ncbi:MAG: Rid family hydrolase [Blastocatellia bacterium]
MKRIILAALLAVLFCGVIATAAFRQKQQSATRRYINLPGRPLQAPFSDAVLVGNTLYLAGWIGIDPKTNKVPEDTDQEVRLLLDHFKAVLAEAGMTMDDLVTVQVFCPDLTKFDQFNAIYRTYFKQNFPARAFIGSGPLLLGGHFEMQAVAVKR